MAEKRIGLFDYDGVVMRFLHELAALALTNALFLLCSISIVTMPSALLALYDVTRTRTEEGHWPAHLALTMLRSMRRNMRKGIVLFACIFIVGAALYLDQLWLLQSAYTAGRGVLLGFLLAAATLLSMLSAYLFPLACRDSIRISDSALTALRLCLLHWWRAVILGVGALILLIVSLRIPALFFMLLPIFLIVGCSLSVRIACILLCGTLPED